MLRRRLLMSAVVGLVALSAALSNGAVRAANHPDSAACLSSPFGPGCIAGLPAVEYQMLLDEMLLHPQPDVRPLAPNMEEIARFAFRRIVGGAADAPSVRAQLCD